MRQPRRQTRQECQHNSPLNSSLYNVLQRLPLVSTRVRILPRCLVATTFLPAMIASTFNLEPMDPSVQRRKRRDIVLSSLDVAIEASNLAKEFCSITPAKPVFASFSVILTMIRVNFFHVRCLLIGRRLT
jgi:hypothetical protein